MSVFDRDLDHEAEFPIAIAFPIAFPIDFDFALPIDRCVYRRRSVSEKSG